MRTYKLKHSNIHIYIYIFILQDHNNTKWAQEFVLVMFCSLHPVYRPFLSIPHQGPPCLQATYQPLTKDHPVYRPLISTPQEEPPCLHATFTEGGCKKEILLHLYTNLKLVIITDSHSFCHRNPQNLKIKAPVVLCPMPHQDQLQNQEEFLAVLPVPGSANEKDRLYIWKRDRNAETKWQTRDSFYTQCPDNGNGHTG